MLESFAHILVMNNPETKPASAPDSQAPSSNASPDFAVAAQPSYTRVLFIGPEGLRAGWGFALYLVAFFLLEKLTTFGADELVHLSPRMSMRLVEAIFELAGFVAAAIPAVILARVERRLWGTYGLPLRQAFGKFFWLGALWGFAGISALMISLYECRDFSFGSVVLHGTRIVKFAAYWSLMFLLVGLFEEFLFRGYTQFTLARGIGFWPAAAVLSVSFGLVHLGNEGERWTGSLAAASIAAFFCLTLRRTGTLWFALGFHAAWDWGESCL